MLNRIFYIFIIAFILWMIGEALKVFREPTGRDYSGDGAYQGMTFKN